MNRVKAILFDVDGVLIRPPYFFSKELEQNGYSKAEKTLNAYYGSDDHLPSLEGRGTCEEAIAPYLRDFGWQQTPREYLVQLFEFDARYLDHDFLNIIVRLKANRVICCLATDQEKLRAHYLLNVMGFGSLFDAHFISCDIGSRKIGNAFWSHVLEKLTGTPFNFEPQDIAFVDDRQSNVEVALRFGIRAVRFESVRGFNNDLAAWGLRQENG
jgi:putative hydrolase of the HAD superfamily